LGDYANSIAAYRYALDLALVSKDQRMEAQLWTNLGQVYGAAGEYVDALPLLMRGLDFKKSRGQSTSLNRALGYVHALACKGLVHSDRGELELVDQHFHDAIEVVQGSNHPMEASILSQHCMALLRRGDWLASEEAARRSIAVAERASIPFLLAISRFFHAFARFMQAPQPEWLSRMRFALEWLENMEQGLYISFVYACMASAYLDCSEATLATEFAERALRRAEQRDLLGEAAAQRVLARIYFNKGRVFLERSEAALARAFRAAELRESPREHTLTSLLEAELMLERGEQARARGTAQAAQLEFARMGMSFYERRAARIAAATSSPQPA
jgi:tetratricopeptide (TPR) repeat protein